MGVANVAVRCRGHGAQRVRTLFHCNVAIEAKVPVVTVLRFAHFWITAVIYILVGLGDAISAVASGKLVRLNSMPMKRIQA